jgi:hypothetical protein
MPVPPHHLVEVLARMMVSRHREAAAQKARERIEQLERLGVAPGVETWERVEREIARLYGAVGAEGADESKFA